MKKFLALIAMFSCAMLTGCDKQTISLPHRAQQIESLAISPFGELALIGKTSKGEKLVWVLSDPPEGKSQRRPVWLTRDVSSKGQPLRLGWKCFDLLVLAERDGKRDVYDIHGNQITQFGDVQDFAASSRHLLVLRPTAKGCGLQWKSWKGEQKWQEPVARIGSILRVALHGTTAFWIERSPADQPWFLCCDLETRAVSHVTNIPLEEDVSISEDAKWGAILDRNRGQIQRWHREQTAPTSAQKK